MGGVINRGIAIIVIALATVMVASAALAHVANRYAGQVVLFSKRPPSRWANDGVFHRFVSAHKTGSVREDESKTFWRVEYMAFFARPVNDREVTIRFYDAQGGSGQYKTSYTLYLNDPRDRVVGGNVKLERPDFQPNQYYKITVASKGRTIARLNKFALIGEAVKRSGEVNFSVEDTRGR